MKHTFAEGINTDDKLNTVLHFFGAVFGLICGLLLIVESSLQGNAMKIVSFSIYAVSLFLLFLASTLHHAFVAISKLKKTLLYLDCTAIYVFIAGTITPFALVALGGATGWLLFGVCWGLALVGISLKWSLNNFPKWFTNAFYLAMGWIGGVLFYFLYGQIHVNALLLLLFGGFAYTIGSFIYYLEKPNLFLPYIGFHELWHFLVLVGAFLHWLALYVYVL